MHVFPRILLVGVILCLGIMPLPAAAQGEGDSSELLISQAVEVVFPAAVIFRADLDVERAAVDGVQLRLLQGDRTLFDGVVSVDFAIGADDTAVTLYFDWPIPANDAPVFFAEITYEWRILLEGAEPLVQQGVFIFQPGAGEWRTGGEAPLSFALSDSTLNLTAARQALLPAYELLAQHTGLTPELQWIVLPQDAVFCREDTAEEGEAEVIVASAVVPGLTYPCSEEIAEQMLAQQGYTILRRDAPGLFQFQADALGGLFRVFYAAYWDDQPVPPWFVAGLQQYYAANPDPFRLRQVQEAARMAVLYDAEQLQRGRNDTDVYDLWPAQSAMLVLYIADRFGSEAPFTLAQSIPEVGFEPAFAALVERSWDVFLLEWERWLFTDAAAQAAAWTVYMPPTAAPTYTAAPLALPTVTVSPSIPPTSQMPAEGSLVAPLPEPEERLRPTNTPRPPGSLGTRVPAVSDSVSQGGTGICGAAALPALLLPGLAFVFTGFYRKQV